MSAAMSGLVDNLLDFARGRLGGGIELERSPDVRLEPVLAQVVSELQSSHPEHRVEMHLVLGHAVDCDHRRVAQVLSNLLGNALTHGAADSPASVRATTDQRPFTLSVTNAGEPIPEAAMASLFKPFSRATLHQRGEGLGLGLYIAAEIARAHGGTLSAESTAQETRFTIPLTRGDTVAGVA